MLTYRLTSPTTTASTLTLVGQASFDGVSAAIAGPRLAVPCARLHLLRPAGGGGWRLRVAGADGWRCCVEISSDLKSWTPLAVANVEGGVTDVVGLAEPPTGCHFYRARLLGVDQQPR